MRLYGPVGVGALLDRLAAGSAQALFSPDDWATRLDDSPSAQQFVAQLRREWLLAEAPDEFCERMVQFAVDYLAAQHPAWPHLWGHTLRVAGAALALASESGVEPADAFLLAVFHDIGKFEELRGGEKHEQVGAQLLREQLSGHYTPQTISLMTEAITKRASSANRYGRLIHNADKLDKIGATGIARRLSTDWGMLHPSGALRRVREDLAHFPEMHFLVSKRMASIKRDFSRAFLASVGELVPENQSRMA